MRLKLKTAPDCEPVTLEEAKNFLKVDIIEDDSLIASLIASSRRYAELLTKRVFITQTWRLIFDEVGSSFEIPKPPLQSVTSIKVINDVASYVDEDSASGQAVLKIASTTGFSAADSIVVDRGGSREEELTVLSVQEGISLTMTSDLSFAHTAAQGDRVEKYALVDKSKYNVDAREYSYSRVSLRTGASWPTHRGFASFVVEFVAGHADDSDGIPENLKQGILVLIGGSYENRGAEGAVKARVHASEEALLLLQPYKILRL